MIEHAVLVLGAEDRAAVVEIEGGLRIALADGAGGTGSGARAAETVIASSSLWAADDELAKFGGQSTAVVLTVREDIEGVSVGDSGAWLVANAQVLDLTRNQRRKPLVGDGAEPVAFASPFPADAVLLVASDGLWRYAKPRDIIVTIARGGALDEMAARLVDLVRLPTGGLQDDVAIVLCRRRA